MKPNFETLTYGFLTREIRRIFHGISERKKKGKTIQPHGRLSQKDLLEASYAVYAITPKNFVFLTKLLKNIVNAEIAEDAEKKLL